ncbi:hypothetical protein GDO81_019166 [Engystomops pustulosus]|uniref:Uncharacterized protein n=1 Tax=Engystomops pustulosus TaxID=76066 RepID=A0AAV6ZIG6_ENGPU|nr:hypothetical protein GDO81_019166 [Engystomops pustulosus]
MLSVLTSSSDAAGESSPCAARFIRVSCPSLCRAQVKHPAQMCCYNVSGRFSPTGCRSRYITSSPSVFLDNVVMLPAAAPSCLCTSAVKCNVCNIYIVTTSPSYKTRKTQTV